MAFRQSTLEVAHASEQNEAASYRKLAANADRPITGRQVNSMFNQSKIGNLKCKMERADDGIRTRDLRFTKPLLYQLSYVGAGPKIASGECASKREAGVGSSKFQALMATAEAKMSRRSRARRSAQGFGEAPFQSAQSVRAKARS